MLYSAISLNNKFYQYKIAQYNSLNVNLSNSQFDKSKSAIKNETEVVLRLSSNMVGDSDSKINFPQELLLTNRQVVNLCKGFANYLSTDIKLSKTQIAKMIQSGGFLGRLLGPLLKTGLPLLKNVIKPLAKSVLIPVGLTAAASAANVGIHKNIFRSSDYHPLPSTLHNNNTILIISNDEMEDITKIAKSLEDFSLLSEGVSEIIQNEAKEQRGGFLSMLLGTLGASLLRDILIGLGINRAEEGIVRTGYRNKRQDYENKMDF